MLLATGCSRLIPWLLKLAIDTLKAEGDLATTTRLALAMVAAAVLGGLFLYLQRWLIIGASRHVEYDLRQDLFRHVQRLDLEFFGSRRTGDLMAHFTNDLTAIRAVAGPGIMYAATMSTMLVVSITLMVVISPLLTVITFAPYPLVSVATFFFGRAMFRRSKVVQDLFGELSARVQEDLSGMRVIRAYCQEANCERGFRRRNRAYLEANMRVAHLRGQFVAAMGLLTGAGLILALLIGGRMVIDKQLSLGSLVAFSAYLAELTWPVIAIGWVIGMVQRGASAAARIEDLRAAQPGILPGPRRSRPAARVQFDRVTFRYPGTARDALQGMSFRLEPRATLGIVGRTGSGKSTILKLLLRFYDPSDGRILIDGKDLRQWDPATVRRMIGYAPQDALLFSRTIAENIAYGAPAAPSADIQRVVRQTRLEQDVAAFPEGLDTLVGERGITLSGGQRQRASLARALLLEPDLLLLDDTLSSVDAATEAAILAELRTLTHGRTAIIVSHRISAVQHADWILVLEDGRLLEEGVHAALLKRAGLYARLHERQRLAAEIEDTT